MSFVTPRQLEVWRRVAAGQHTKEICRGLARYTHMRIAIWDEQNQPKLDI